MNLKEALHEQELISFAMFADRVELEQLNERLKIMREWLIEMEIKLDRLKRIKL